jgi:hypothetical protein
MCCVKDKENDKDKDVDKEKDIDKDKDTDKDKDIHINIRIGKVLKTPTNIMLISGNYSILTRKYYLAMTVQSRPRAS